MNGGVTFNLGMFKIDYKKYSDIQNGHADIFEALIEEFQKTHKKIF